MTQGDNYPHKLNMTQAELINLIEKQAEARNLAPATLCRLAVGNNRLLRNLKAGRSCTLEVAERFSDWIETNPTTEAATQ
ncbi:hypothetical protein PM02_10455 [Sulfitobacter mediterraneus]|uniref:Uncharacterized protein n=1 Tax=Sulfitobacter mediterraneus TaxID=83219 RepID=A0A061SUV0_9RHOB|nr:hypothetical protein PM02_10455 [Sulfitobacter mediterraneus]